MWLLLLVVLGVMGIFICCVLTGKQGKYEVQGTSKVPEMNIPPFREGGRGAIRITLGWVIDR